MTSSVEWVGGAQVSHLLVGSCPGTGPRGTRDLKQTGAPCLPTRQSALTRKEELVQLSLPELGGSWRAPHTNEDGESAQRKPPAKSYVGSLADAGEVTGLGHVGAGVSTPSTAKLTALTCQQQEPETNMARAWGLELDQSSRMISHCMDRAPWRPEQQGLQEPTHPARS